MSTSRRLRKHHWLAGLGAGVGCACGALGDVGTGGTEFHLLGQPPQFSQTYGLSVSRMGNIAAGAQLNLSNSRTWTWTRSAGLQPLPGIDSSSYVEGVTSDGGVVVGHNLETNGRAFYWSTAAPSRNLLPLTSGTTSSNAWGVSEDGAVIVGSCSSSSTNSTAVKWTSGVATTLPSLQSGGRSVAWEVTGDGSRAVGVSPSASGARAVVWDGEAISSVLSPLPGFSGSEARSVSPSGNAVVGLSSSASTFLATRWIDSGTPQTLGHLGGGYSVAEGTSEGGAVVVGLSSLPVGQSQWMHAFMWSQSTGMVDLNTFVASRGINLGSLTLVDARAVSADGNTIVGWGIDTVSATHRGWVIIVPTPGASSALMLLGLIASRRRRR